MKERTDVEQDFQKQTPGHHRDSVRDSAYSAGKGARVICCLGAGVEQGLDVSEIVRCAQERGTSIEALYDGGINLPHYGEVDQLAPAGAMSEFVAYVREQALREAEDAFAPLRAAAESCGVAVTVRVLYGRSALTARLREASEHGAARVFPAECAEIRG